MSYSHISHSLVNGHGFPVKHYTGDMTSSTLTVAHIMMHDHITYWWPVGNTGIQPKYTPDTTLNPKP